MKNKLRKNANKKHTKLIKHIYKYSNLVKDNILSVQDYLKLNRYYFSINIG